MTEYKELSLQDLIVKLYDVKGLLFGQFTMRTGEISPVYVNMRVIWSYPDIVRSVSEMMWSLSQKNGLKYKYLLGLPYQGIPIASYLSTKYNIPMLLKRQQAKTYGTCQLVEGAYNEGDTALLIDDVIMTGGTVVKDAPVLREEGLKVTDCLCFIDRGQGGTVRAVETVGVTTISVITLDEAMEILLKAGRIGQDTVDATRKYLKENCFDAASAASNS